MKNMMRLLVVAMLVAPALGCGSSESSFIAGSNELTPEAIAEQEAVLSAAEAAETARNR